MRKVYYFGCMFELGHNLYRENGSKVYNTEIHNTIPPYSLANLDGEYAPVKRNKNTKTEVREGLVKLSHYASAWTIIAFWDRSVDTRPGSNSAFIIKGVYNYDEAIFMAKQSFPHLFERFSRRFVLEEYEEL